VAGFGLGLYPSPRLFPYQAKARLWARLLLLFHHLLTFFLMNQKRTFGSILTILGIIGIIMGAMGFLGVGGLHLGKTNSVVPFIVGLIFFFAGINLVKTTSDRA
jgi:uncharacterized membrane protein